MASFPFSGDYLIIIVGRNWQLLPMLTPFVSNGDSMDMEFRILGATLRQCQNRSSHQPYMKYGLTSLRLLQQIQISKFNNSIIHHFQDDVEWKFPIT